MLTADFIKRRAMVEAPAIFRDPQPHFDEARRNVLRRIASHYIAGGEMVEGVNKRLISAQGFSFIVPADDVLIAPIAEASGVYEPETTNYFKRVVRPDSHCLDVGANFGYFACLLGRLASKGRVVSVEADPELFEMLDENVVMNGLILHTQPVNLGVSDAEGELTLHRRRSRSGNTSIIVPPEGYTDAMGEPPAEPFTIASKPIDALLPMLGGRLDHMKLDIEGAEPLALRGMSDTIAANPQIQIMMEWAPAQIAAAGFDVWQFADEIAGMGFDMSLVQADMSLLRISTDDLKASDYLSGVLLTR